MNPTVGKKGKEETHKGTKGGPLSPKIRLWRKKKGGSRKIVPKKGEKGTEEKKGATLVPHKLVFCETVKGKGGKRGIRFNPEGGGPGVKEFQFPCHTAAGKKRKERGGQDVFFIIALKGGKRGGA